MRNIKKNGQGFILSIIILLFVINLFLKFSMQLLVVNLIILIALIYSYKCNYENKNIINVFSIITIIISSLSIFFKSLNGSGMLLLYLFLLIITLTIMIKSNLIFEIALPVSTSIIILLFVLFGIVGILKYSFVFLIILTIICLCFLFKNKEKTLKSINSINKHTYIIFSILFLIAILSGIGRYVHKWDEYSYWAYAAKVLINTDSFKVMISSVSSMYNYPPVSSVWHYIVSIFIGYSEPNLYIGLSILTYIYMLPLFIYCKNKKILFNILFVLSAVCFPLLFDGSISYGLLYVDLLLGVMCACTLVLKDYIENHSLNRIPLYLLLIIITLLKPNGFVFSCCLLLLFYLKDLMKLEKLSFKEIFNSIKKYLVLILISLLIYGLWYLFSKLIGDASYGYMFELIPDSLKTDILPKLNTSFLFKFFNGIINSFDESILYSFINIPLFVFLGIIFTFIVYLEKNKKTSELKVLIPYTIFYITFLFLTALSLFIMFSYYEASILASFTRYLAPINIALSLYTLYKLSIDKKNVKISYIFYIVTVLLIGFSNCTFFITDIKERRETARIKEHRNEIFSVVNENTANNSKIYVLNQTDEEGIMPIWYARFYCYPRVINASSVAITWKIKTQSNEWDLKDWGFNAETFSKHLLEYKFDYLYLYSKTDELYNELKQYFDDLSIAKNYSLFKIKSINGSVKLIPIK